MRKVVLLMLAISCLLSAGEANAQKLEEGTWLGLMASPGRQFIDITIPVVYHDGEAVMEVEWAIGTFPLMDIAITERSLAFKWNPSFDIDCRMVLDEAGIYKGGCKDIWGGIGPISLAPPGIDISPEHISIKRAFEVWGIDPEEKSKEKIDEADLYPEKPEGTLVKVNSHRLNMVEMGAGEFTVVLESGLGDDSGVWEMIQKRLAIHTRVISYDRAGLGLSEPGNSPKTPTAIATELHQMLEAAQIAPPYVLVGHAAGSFYVRAFAERYPDEVASLVLVEPAHEKLGKGLEALDKKSWETYQKQQETFYSMFPESAQAEFKEYHAILEAGSFNPSTLPSVPLRVLTSMRPIEEPRWVGESASGQLVKQGLHKAWIEGRANAEHINALLSGPYIHQEDPDVVAQVIVNVLAHLGDGS